MKWALVVLLCSLLTISNQNQIFGRPWMQYVLQNQPTARSQYVPLFYANGVPAGYDVVKDEKIDQFNPMQRFLANFSSRPGIYLVTSTSTIVEKVTSVITTVTGVNCIASSQFAVNGTTACARKRRNVHDLLMKHDDSFIEPDTPLPMEVSAMPEMNSRFNHAAEHLGSIQSSFTEVRPDTHPVFQARAFSSVVNVTSTSVVYSFVPTTIFTTKTIANSGALSCLPAGYSVC